MRFPGLIHHSIHTDFWELLRAAVYPPTPLESGSVVAALGLIYKEDPAAELLAPYARSVREVGTFLDEEDNGFAPPWVMQKAYNLRATAIDVWFEQDHPSLIHDELDIWTRAGLVLEIGSRHGINYYGCLRRPKWRLNGTVTTRFGLEHGSWNPMVIAKEDRFRLKPSGPTRHLAVIDFVAIDLCSMLSIVPGLKERYEGASDLHDRTAELIGLERFRAKNNLFIHAYGGHSLYQSAFEDKLPELGWLRDKEPHGTGARLVQTESAKRFRCALSEALPLLVGSDVRPMFTVHDELVLDVSEDSDHLVQDVALAMSTGASRGTVHYRTKVTLGNNYDEAKR